LATAFTGLGHGARVTHAETASRFEEGDLVIARLDFLPTLDGIEPGLWRLPRLERQGVQVINRLLPLLAAHDKLSTALMLRGAGVEQPRTAHVCKVSVPTFPPPYVVKPRFGSWGRDVYLCRDEGELRAQLEHLGHRHWSLRAAAALGLDLAGVDIASDRTGRSYVLEVNGAVDFNSIYADDVFAETAAALLGQAAVGARLIRDEIRSSLGANGSIHEPQMEVSPM
jgi:glutathione synthase/RimK-type ligase-like ATP-grasp enzyme